jgi:hypothetical protein
MRSRQTRIRCVAKGGRGRQVDYCTLGFADPVASRVSFCPADTGPCITLIAASKRLLFKAGPVAYRSIRDEGFDESRIGTILGASGGAKWLVLSQLDRVIASRFLPAVRHPVHMLGSSIGAWRFTCYAQADPLAAIERFEQAYLEQTYSDRPDVAEITATSRAILDEVLGDNGVREILGHPYLRTHIMTVRARNLTATDRRPVLGVGLLLAMSANAVNRRALGAFFERGLFFDSRDEPPFIDAPGFPLHRIPLTEHNLADAVVASGSIPMVLAGVRNIHGAPPGTYRDGGVIDYHLDLPNSRPGCITLYPHFFGWLKAGWFDRQLKWRGVNRVNYDETLLVCPSPEFVESLPGSKVPDRRDFVNLPPAERMKRWRGVVTACKALAEDLNDVLDKGQVGARLEPLW